MGKRLDALPGTELGGGLCRDAAERRGGAYAWKQFILKLVHKHTATTALQTVNMSLRQAGSVQEHCVWKYRVIRNDCQGFNNLSYTIHLR